MPPAFADSLLFTLAGTLRRSARAVGTGRSLGAARIPVARLELGPLGPPGHQLQVDVKFIEPLGQTGRRRKYYQFTAIDDCTRLRVLRAYPRCDQKTAIAFVDDVMAKLPFAVERVQTDNGSEFGASFHWHLLDKGIDQVRIKPRTPRLNGKWKDPTPSTPKSSTDSSKARSSTTPACSLRSCKSGRTTTTTTALPAL